MVGNTQAQEAFRKRMDEARAKWSPETKALAETLAESYDLGACLYSLRHAAKMSQRQLSELTGVPTSEISKVEHGRVGITIERGNRLLRPFGQQLRPVQVAALSRVVPQTPVMQSQEAGAAAQSLATSKASSPTSGRAGR